MKKILMLLFTAVALFILCFSLNVGAQGLKHGIFTYEINSSGVTVTGCDDENIENIIIPSVIDGLPVTAIDDSAFGHMYNLKTLIIADSVEIVGSYAFAECEALESVILGKNVKSIGADAFYYCENLSTLSWGDKIETIGRSAFGCCKLLENITFPSSLTTLGNEAFSSCSSLKSVNFSNAYVSIGKEVFLGCDLLSDVNLGNAVSIGNGVFKYCDSVCEITIPDSTVSIGEYAFYECINLKRLTLGKNVETIGNYAFDECTSLDADNTIIIGSKMKKIGLYAFYGCKSKIIFNAVGTYIMSDAFCYCENFLTEKLVLSSCDSNAFIGCKNIKEISFVDGSYIGMSAFSGLGVEKVDFTGVMGIDRYSFSGCTSLKSVKLTNRVKEIPEGAFYGCTSLVSVDLGGGVQTIGKSAFDDCSALKSVLGTENLVEIRANAFYRCISLKNITLHEGLKEIFGYAFYNCTALEEITIPGTVFDLGGYNFGNCTSLKKVIIKNGVKILWYDLFRGCTNLYDVTIPASVENICSGVFEDCGALRRIYIESKHLIIFNEAFLSCGITDIYYSGTEEEWNSFNVMEYGNDCIFNAHKHFKSTSSDYVVNDTRYSDIIFTVYDGRNINRALAGATVTINGVSKTTDIDGVAGFTKDEINLWGNVCEVKIQKDGFLTFSDIKYTLNHNGKCTVILDCKTPGFIYITSLTAESAAGKNYNLLERSDFVVTSSDVGEYTFTAEVDWNNLKEGSVFLVGRQSGKKLEFTNGKLKVSPSLEFPDGEKIYVVAESSDGKTKAETPGVVSIELIPEDFSLVIPEISDDASLGFVEFLEGFTLSAESDEPLENIAGSVKVEDGKLVIDFNYNTSTKNYPKNHNMNLLGKASFSAGPYGKIEIPLIGKDKDKIFGYFGSKFNLDKIYEDSYNTVVVIGGVPTPVTVGVELSAEMISLLHMSGLKSDPKISGHITPSLTFDVFGGLGADYDTVELKAGVYGNANAELGIGMDMMSGGVEFSPEFEGEYGLRASAKVWLLEFEKETSLGRFIWNKEEGAKWESDIFSASLMSENSSKALTLIGRDYLENDSFFAGDQNIGLCSDILTNVDEQKIYVNTFYNTESALSADENKTYLFFTVDSTKREPQNGLTLMFSERNSDGSWSEPASVCDDGTLDSVIKSHGKFVIWEDMNKEFGSDETSLSEVFGASEISVAKLTDDGFEALRLTQNNIFDYSPVIISKGDTAFAAWLSNTANDWTAKEGTTSLHMSFYDGEKWSETETMTDIGQVTRIDCAYAENVPCVFFKRDGKIFYVQQGSVYDTYIYADQYAVTSGQNDVSLAYTNSGTLFYSQYGRYSSGSPVATDCECDEAPLFSSNGDDLYLCWMSHKNGYDTLTGVRFEDGKSSEPIVFFGKDFSVSNPSVVVKKDGSLVASYLKSSGNFIYDTRDLCVSVLTPGYDLCLSCAECDGELLRDFGVCSIYYKAENKGEKEISSFAVNLFKNGELLKRETVEANIRAGSEYEGFLTYSPETDGNTDGKYTLTVTTVETEEYDYDNNSIEFDMGSTDLWMEEAYVTSENGLVYINAIVSNVGSAKSETVSVNIYSADSEEDSICTVYAEPVLPGEKVFIKECIPGKYAAQCSLYTVTANTVQETEIHNNQSYAVSNVPDGETTIVNSLLYDKELHILNANITSVSVAKAIVALYDSNGNMLSIVSFDVNEGRADYGFPVESVSGAVYGKLLLWDAQMGIRPLADVNVWNIDLSDPEKPSEALEKDE